MEKLRRLSVVGTALVLLGACAQTNCRENHRAETTAPTTAGGSTDVNKPATPATEAPIRPVDTSKEATIGDQVRVYKPDGSLQCDQGKPVSLDEMKKQLGSIPVLQMIKKSDGLMRIQQCGSPTGMSNVYSIERKNLSAATKLGFKEWTKD